jgi:multisubunit Na+/H+ antiporter MnhF subunit
MWCSGWPPCCSLAVLFARRAIAGPSLSDRVIGIDGVILSGMSIIIVNAMDTGRGAFLPAAVVLALVSFAHRCRARAARSGRGPPLPRTPWPECTR